MKISQILETQEGAVQFSADLNPDEVSYIINVGLTHLLKLGALQLEEEGREGEISVN